MNQQWRLLAARFDALARRERGLVAAATLMLVCFLGYSLLIEPQLLRQAGLSKRVNESRTQSAGIAAQLAGLSVGRSDPDAANRAALAQTKLSLAVLDAKLRGLGQSLVPPEQMQAFLESLLSRHHHLELLSLRTLPPTPLIEPTKPAGKPHPAAAGAVPSAAAAATAAPNIYKHGVEIRIAGSYNDLLTYLTEIERLPQRILWNRVTLKVDKYPRNVLTLTVYTLSLDKQWLVV